MEDHNFKARMRLAYRVGVLEALLTMAGVGFPSEEETDKAHDDFLARASALIASPPPATPLEQQLRASVEANEAKRSPAVVSYGYENGRPVVVSLHGKGA